MEWFCFGDCGREAGPTISVSQSTIYITGTSEDELSGTAIYRYDPPNSQGEVKTVDNITTEKFTAPQFELTTSGVWKFTGIDQAGNSDSAETENIKLYLCNYCNQKTVSLNNHYRCPTHYSSQTCSTNGACQIVTANCTGTYSKIVRKSVISNSAGCHVCGNSPCSNWDLRCTKCGDSKRFPPLLGKLRHTLRY